MIQEQNKERIEKEQKILNKRMEEIKKGVFTHISMIHELVGKEENHIVKFHIKMDNETDGRTTEKKIRKEDFSIIREKTLNIGKLERAIESKRLEILYVKEEEILFNRIKSKEKYEEYLEDFALLVLEKELIQQKAYRDFLKMYSGGE